MKIIETYSHLNGLEFLIVHKPKLWKEIKNVVLSVDAEICKTKVSKEKTMKGKLLYSPIDMNSAFSKLLRANKWAESRVSYWATLGNQERKTDSENSHNTFRGTKERN